MMRLVADNILRFSRKFGYEEERVWGRTWIPPPELLGAVSIVL